MRSDPTVTLSVVIVNYNVKHFAEQCLRSVIDSAAGLAVEIFLVDNASDDGSIDFLTPRFPSVRFIANCDNRGFAAANNQALAQAKGKYLLLLNPDCLVSREALPALVRYLDERPKVGAAGLKLLSRYGEFDRASKRGFPTPWVAFCRLSGLANLFPKSRIFGRYDLLYFDEDTPAEVDALSGACIAVRREAYAGVGGLDEAFFMYGEDIDWCYRLKLAGWEVHYAPVASIIHFRGESTRRSRIDRDRAFYGAMHLFVDKHFRGKYPRFAHRLIDAGIILAAAAAKTAKLYHRLLWPLTDFTLIYGVILAARLIRFEGSAGMSPVVFLALAFQALVFVGSLAAFGAYSHRRGDRMPLLAGLFLGFLINSSFTYFFKQFAYSRFVNLFGLVVGGSILLTWRALLHRLRKTDSYRRFYQRRALVVGVGRTAEKVLKELGDRESHYRVLGLVDPSGSSVGSILNGAPVLGREDELDRLIQLEEIEEIIFAYDELDYNHIVELASRIGGRKVGFKVIAPDGVEAPAAAMPFLSVEYLNPRRIGGSLRKLTTLLLGRE